MSGPYSIYQTAKRIARFLKCVKNRKHTTKLSKLAKIERLFYNLFSWQTNNRKVLTAQHWALLRSGCTGCWAISSRPCLCQERLDQLNLEAPSNLKFWLSEAGISFLVTQWVNQRARTQHLNNVLLVDRSLLFLLFYVLYPWLRLKLTPRRWARQCLHCASTIPISRHTGVKSPLPFRTFPSCCVPDAVTPGTDAAAPAAPRRGALTERPGRAGPRGWARGAGRRAPALGGSAPRLPASPAPPLSPPLPWVAAAERGGGGGSGGASAPGPPPEGAAGPRRPRDPRCPRAASCAWRGGERREPAGTPETHSPPPGPGAAPLTRDAEQQQRQEKAAAGGGGGAARAHGGGAAAAAGGGDTGARRAAGASGRDKNLASGHVRGGAGPPARRQSSLGAAARFRGSRTGCSPRAASGGRVWSGVIRSCPSPGPAAAPAAGTPAMASAGTG